MQLLASQTLTVTEYTGEDASGNATPRVTAHSGAYSEFSERRVSTSEGALAAGSGLVAFDDTTGWGVTWSLKSGDTVTLPSGRVLNVLSVFPSTNPRTGELHHVEATVGG